MFTKRIVTIAMVFALSVIMLFVYPTTDKSMYAGQSKSTKDASAPAKVHRISVSSDEVLVHYFGKDIVEKTMKQTGCVSVRMYYAKHADGKFGFVIVGVDKNGRDLESTILTGPASYCPPICND
jgi:hypothetical protein